MNRLQYSLVVSAISPIMFHDNNNDNNDNNNNNDNK
jgi:hypothetical protein